MLRTKVTNTNTITNRVPNTVYLLHLRDKHVPNTYHGMSGVQQATRAKHTLIQHVYDIVFCRIASIEQTIIHYLPLEKSKHKYS